ETSLSINTWVPLDVDIESQIDECIVQTQITGITNNLNDELRTAVINPNEIKTLVEFNLNSQLKLLQNLLSYRNNLLNKRVKLNSFPHKYLSSEELTELLGKCEDVTQSEECMSKEEFFKLLKINSERFNSDVNDGIESSAEYRSLHSFINSFCQPDVIESVKNNLINGWIP
ncbi:hypothetical protein Bhyg_17999, partial [Pseudolycoriella hygida]